MGDFVGFNVGLNVGLGEKEGVSVLLTHENVPNTRKRKTGTPIRFSEPFFNKTEKVSPRDEHEF